MLHLSNDKQINDLRIELASKQTYIDVLRMQMIITIIDRISINHGGIFYLSNHDEYVEALATKLSQASSDELIVIFRNTIK